MTLNNEKEIKISANQELQAKLIAIVSNNNIEALKDSLKAILNIRNFNFTKKDNILIKDTYYDSEDFDLKSVGACIRIREIDNNRHITIKKEKGDNVVGERNRIEFTKDVDKDKISGYEKSNFSYLLTKHFPELAGKIIVKQIIVENHRVIYCLTHDKEEYILSFDTYSYRLSESDSRSKDYFEIEIEAVNEQARNNLSSLKIDIVQDLKEFSYSQGNKYSRGIDIKVTKKTNKDKGKYSIETKTAIIVGIVTIIGIIYEIYTK